MVSHIHQEEPIMGFPLVKLNMLFSTIKDHNLDQDSQYLYGHK